MEDEFSCLDGEVCEADEGDAEVKVGRLSEGILVEGFVERDGVGSEV